MAGKYENVERTAQERELRELEKELWAAWRSQEQQTPADGERSMEAVMEAAEDFEG